MELKAKEYQIKPVAQNYMKNAAKPDSKRCSSSIKSNGNGLAAMPVNLVNCAAWNLNPLVIRVTVEV